MLPASPAFFSCRAHQEIRWSAARTSAGGSSRPASAAFPLSSAHRCTRASLAASSRRRRAFSGATSITARAIADRSPPGVSRPARPSTLLLRRPRLPRIEHRGGPGDDLRLGCRSVPARNAALVPGSLTSRSRARSSIASAAPRPSASSWAISSPANSSRSAGSRAAPATAQPGAGRRRVNSARAACLRAHAVASARSSAPITPASSSSLAPANRSPAPAASSANPSSTPPPGATSSGCPVPNPPAGPAYSPGTRRAEPGIPGPRRPTFTPACGMSASRGSRAAHSASAACSAARPAAIRRDSARSASRSTSSGSAGSSGSGYHPGSSSGSGGASPLSAAASHASHRSGSAIGSTPGGTGRHPSASSMGSPATSHPQVGSGCESPGACAPRASFSPGPRSEGAGPRGMHHHPFGGMVLTL